MECSGDLVVCAKNQALGFLLEANRNRRIEVWLSDGPWYLDMIDSLVS